MNNKKEASSLIKGEELNFGQILYSSYIGMAARLAVPDAPPMLISRSAPTRLLVKLPEQVCMVKRTREGRRDWS